MILIQFFKTLMIQETRIAVSVTLIKFHLDCRKLITYLLNGSNFLLLNNVYMLKILHHLVSGNAKARRATRLHQIPCDLRCILRPIEKYDFGEMSIASMFPNCLRSKGYLA